MRIIAEKNNDRCPELGRNPVLLIRQGEAESGSGDSGPSRLQQSKVADIG
jgi:hypothetical protein